VVSFIETLAASACYGRCRDHENGRKHVLRRRFSTAARLGEQDVTCAAVPLNRWEAVSRYRDDGRLEIEDYLLTMEDSRQGMAKSDRQSGRMIAAYRAKRPPRL